MTTQKQWLDNQKSSCNFCHQIGNEITRTLDHMDMDDLGVFDPVDNDTWEVIIPTRENAREVSSRFPAPAMSSNVWGYERLWGPSTRPLGFCGQGIEAQSRPEHGRRPVGACAKTTVPS